MKIALILLNFLIVSACTPSKVAETTSGNINVNAPFLWSSNAFPRNMRISTEFTNDEVANILAMSTAWETAVQNREDFFEHDINNDTITDRTTEISSPNLRLDDLGDDNVNGIYKITDWPSALPGSALAVTQIFGRRYNIGSSNEYVRIEHADILLNEDIYDFRTTDAHVNNTFDLRTVMLHELGHFLGLAHQSGDTVMIPSIGENSTGRTPTSTDAANLSDKYVLNMVFGLSSNVMALSRPQYAPMTGDSGKMIKIQIELMAEGECVHRENGAMIGRHSVKLKN
jgi:predicted Zn-dependent protease